MAAVNIAPVPDEYGQNHPVESPGLIQSKLEELEAALIAIPADQKVAWNLAKRKCPDQLNDDFHLMFLRAEVFKADVSFSPHRTLALESFPTKRLFQLAATRITKYWQKRLEICGKEKAFLPFTLNGALKDDEMALSLGFAIVLDKKTSFGRKIVLLDPSKEDRTKYTRNGYLRSLWYTIHVALEDEETQRKGAVFLVSPRGGNPKDFDLGASRQVLRSVQGCLPVRVSAVHVFDPGASFVFIFSLVKYFIGPRMRKRFNVHSGSTSKVLNEVDRFGLAKDNLPRKLGGYADVDPKRFLQCRKASGK
mmetsp:Transcript_13465/g.22926  ORF Transcript_13465/g.22926 Transcript_13465/m.22926 type:complete len:307 (-) Transcript_13465:161-1081(-)